MNRQLTALEMRLITGTRDAVSKVSAFAALGIPTTPRDPTGHMVIDCIAFNDHVRQHLTELEWSVIRDENIETFRCACEQSRRYKENVHRQHQGPACVLDSFNARRKETHQ